MSSAFPATDSAAGAGPDPASPQHAPSTTFGAILRRAVLAGLLAGALAAVFVGLVAEDSIDAAIAIEEAAALQGSDEAADGHSHGDEEPLVTRGQQVVGGLMAAIVFGLVVGVVFGTVYAAIRHRITVADETRRVLLLAAAAYTATALLPALKYPANPPAVGDPGTVNERTVLYFTFLAACVILAVAVGIVYKRLAARHDRSSALTMTGWRRWRASRRCLSPGPPVPTASLRTSRHSCCGTFASSP